jgi:hypothetical protein
MEGFRIRRDGVEIAVPDVAGLIRLAREGGLAHTDEVRTAGGWLRVEEVAELRALVRNDPWAAWEKVDEVDATALYRKMVEVVGDPEELPAEALAPVPAPKAKRPAPPVSVEPLPLDPGAADPDLDDDGGEVIDFPRRESRRPPPDVPIRPARPRPDRRRPEPAVRASRVGAWVVAGLLLLLVGYAWIRVGGAPTGVTQAPPPSATKAAPPSSSAGDAMIQLDAELRGKLPPLPKEVKEKGDLADALMVEMVQLGVSVAKVDAPVTKWVGRRLDEPKVAEVRVLWQSSGDLTRDIAAIALVVGRYKKHYQLDLTALELTEQATNKVLALDPVAVEAFYLGRTPLGKFLTAVIGG